MDTYIEIEGVQNDGRREYRRSSSRRIMAKLNKYMRKNGVTTGEVKSHKLRFPYKDFYLGDRKTGTLYLQAHLRHILGVPRYWSFEFRLDGSERHMTLEDFAFYKIAMTCAFHDKKDNFVLWRTCDRYSYLIKMLEKLRGFHVEGTYEKISVWFDRSNPDNIYQCPYIQEYRKLTRSVSPRSRRYITIMNE